VNLIEKETIRYWRGEGLGYKAIAAKTGITENAIKGFCKRNGLGSDYDPNTCHQCGSPIEQRPKCKPRKFCSAACCQTWWNAHPYLAEKKANYRLTCAHCGQAFISYGNRGRKYCGRPCYMGARFGKGAARQ